MIMQRLIQAYEDMINSIWIRSQFKDERGFAVWCYSGTIEDLNCALRVFLDEEMYEDCAIIRDVIAYKKSEII